MLRRRNEGQIECFRRNSIRWSVDVVFLAFERTRIVGVELQDLERPAFIYAEAQAATPAREAKGLAVVVNRVQPVKLSRRRYVAVVEYARETGGPEVV